MPMDFGMPTLLETPINESAAAMCTSLGLRFLELNMNLPQYHSIWENIRTLRQTADRHGIYYTIHLDENLNPFDFNDLVAAAWTETALRTIGAAKELCAPIVNMHLSPGVYFTLPEQKVYLYRAYRDDYLRRVCAFRDNCDAAIGSAAITLCVENTNGYTDFQLEALRLLLESPHFGLTLDAGHNYSAGNADEQWILKSGRLRHMHLHDAKGANHHLPLGDGELDIQQYLDLAKAQNCRVVLETKTVDGLKRSCQLINKL